MARRSQKQTKKEGAVRKQEFLDCALDLFFRTGYEKTSVNDIIDKVGVSKGAFYHYFKSKDDVLIAIAEHVCGNIAQIIDGVVSDKKLTAVEKFNRIIACAQEYKIAPRDPLFKIYKITSGYENMKFRRRFIEAIEYLIEPSVKKIIRQGIAEKTFNTAYPDEVGDLYVELVTVFMESIMKLMSELRRDPSSMRIIKRRLNFYEDFFARILGIKRGSIKITREAIRYLHDFSRAYGKYF